MCRGCQLHALEIMWVYVLGHSAGHRRHSSQPGGNRWMYVPQYHHRRLGLRDNSGTKPTLLSRYTCLLGLNVMFDRLGWRTLQISRKQQQCQQLLLTVFRPNSAIHGWNIPLYSYQAYLSILFYLLVHDSGRAIIIDNLRTEPGHSWSEYSTVAFQQRIPSILFYLSFSFNSARWTGDYKFGLWILKVKTKSWKEELQRTFYFLFSRGFETYDKAHAST